MNNNNNNNKLKLFNNNKLKLFNNKLKLFIYASTLCWWRWLWQRAPA